MVVLVMLVAILLGAAGAAHAQIGCTRVDDTVLCGDSFIINSLTSDTFQTVVSPTARTTCIGFEPGATHQGLIHVHNPTSRPVPVIIEWLNARGVVVFSDQFSLDPIRTATVGRGDVARDVPNTVRVSGGTGGGKSLLVDASMVYDFDPVGPNLHRRQVACFKK
jgi:hypothetical protein